MSKKVIEQSYNYDKYIKDMLKAEKEIIRSLSNFLCTMLNEIQNSNITIQEKIKLAETLLGSIGYKEKGLGIFNDVLEKIIQEDNISKPGKVHSGWLKAGEIYPILIKQGYVIDSIEVVWEDEGKGAKGELIIDNYPHGEKQVSDNLGNAIWENLNKTALKASIKVADATARIISTTVNYKVTTQ